ncbi:MAG: aminotransferase class I/II-fold pyridoxal phosphate-dependent enzyme [Gemmatimonadota bacterium]|nr:aminotransferase class I/II-fold pyridoxal phosphate-dependent enzyme [Gemmatimonadota bacterium]
MHFETLAVHAGQPVDNATRAVSQPIHVSTTFERAADLTYPGGHVYSRTSNPNRDALERCLAALDGGAQAAVFASGQAATMTIFQALAPGDHVIAPNDAYFGTGKLLREVFAPLGVVSTFVDLTDLAAVERALRPETKLIWIESPSNPLLRVTDIAAVVAIARRGGAQVACDNTWATPVLCRPIELGADFVMHATTKYLGGHSDVLGGAVIAREDDAMFQRIRLLQRSGGAVPSPFDCWLVMRGVRTVAYRVRAQSESAMAIAQQLETNPAVERVHYPGLLSHAAHAVAKRQMSAFGGMMSIQVKGGRDAAIGVAARCQIFTRATSLGGSESLIEHRESIEPPESKTPPNLLRISIGLEHRDDLIADLDRALAG